LLLNRPTTRVRETAHYPPGQSTAGPVRPCRYPGVPHGPRYGFSVFKRSHFSGALTRFDRDFAVDAVEPVATLADVVPHAGRASPAVHARVRRTPVVVHAAEPAVHDVFRKTARATRARVSGGRVSAAAVVAHVRFGAMEPAKIRTDLWRSCPQQVEQHDQRPDSPKHFGECVSRNSFDAH